MLGRGVQYYFFSYYCCFGYVSYAILGVSSMLVFSIIRGLETGEAGGAISVCFGHVSSNFLYLCYAYHSTIFGVFWLLGNYLYGGVLRVVVGFYVDAFYGSITFFRLSLYFFYVSLDLYFYHDLSYGAYFRSRTSSAQGVVLQVRRLGYGLAIVLVWYIYRIFVCEGLTIVVGL